MDVVGGEVEAAVRAVAQSVDAPLVLAVSGGLDSMALLVATARVARDRVAVVATFDHGTGAAASAAVAHVARTAGAAGFTVVVGHQSASDRAPDGWEAAWRRERHGFLANVACRHDARVMTAHTEDDQVETVLLRLMRGSGTRGLAALEAPSDLLRPFLRVRRATLSRYIAAAGVAWVQDPGNASSAHLRNRLRHDLLPALRGADPTLDDTLIAVGRAAGAWRRRLDVLVAAVLAPELVPGGGVAVRREELAGHGADSISVLWGAVAGQVGLALDRRGTERVTSFIMQGATRGAMPLSGGWLLEARRDEYRLVRASIAGAPQPLPTTGVLAWGSFRFRVTTHESLEDGQDVWSAWVPCGDAAIVRGWVAGDRLAQSGGHLRRRVARYLSDAGLHGGERAGWPVVVTGGGERDEVVWIPGVRRSDAASERSGRPGRHYVCERIGR